MSSIPPPPPAPSLSSSSALTSPKAIQSHLTAEKSFEVQLEEATRCQRNDLNSNEHLVVVCTENLTQGLLQDGPTCGFAALQMALDAFKVENAPSLATLLKRAKDAGFTNNGEMFDLENFKKICGDFVDCRISPSKELLRLLIAKTSSSCLMTSAKINIRV